MRIAGFVFAIVVGLLVLQGNAYAEESYFSWRPLDKKGHSWQMYHYNGKVKREVGVCRCVGITYYRQEQVCKLWTGESYWPYQGNWEDVNSLGKFNTLNECVSWVRSMVYGRIFP